MAAHLCCRILLYVLILCVCSHAVCNADDIIEYFQALKRSCEEAERRWFTMDTNLLEHIHRKMQDHLSARLESLQNAQRRSNFGRHLRGQIAKFTRAYLERIGILIY